MIWWAVYLGSGTGVILLAFIVYKIIRDNAKLELKEKQARDNAEIKEKQLDAAVNAGYASDRLRDGSI